MGPTRRARIRILPVVLAALALVAFLSGCSSSNIEAEDLLLDPKDFSGLDVTAANAQSTVTLLGVSAAQVDLSGPNFVLSESVTLFETRASAFSVLAGIKQDQLAQGVVSINSNQFDDASGISIEDRGEQEYLSFFFVEGRALVKVTMSGIGAKSLLDSFAEKARSKVSKQ